MTRLLTTGTGVRDILTGGGGGAHDETLDDGDGGKGHPDGPHRLVERVLRLVRADDGPRRPVVHSVLRDLQRLRLVRGHHQSKVSGQRSHTTNTAAIKPHTSSQD